MLNDKSVLKFFSRDHEKSNKLEAELASLKSQVKAVNSDTPEADLKALQAKTDKIAAEVKALRTVALKTMSIEAFKALPHIKLDENEMSHLQVFEQRKAVIMLCSELTTEQFDLLAAPDFHKLHRDTCDYILTPSDVAMDKPLNEDVFAWDLMHPFTNEVQESHSHIRFHVPKTIHSEELAKLTDDEQREDFMFRVVTGLEKSDFAFLSTNDYLALKPQVGAFF
ncbi:phage tail assembly protein [Vibrio sp. 03-59-1]|uniref:phage tail assembly protein n=1 Tax=Vibrio sp. 03-59-1 TaxID=2607607 RepID=UPI0020A540BE|nr:phage tail assembly protein [Vibrio sp. 03-59-1]